MKYSILALLIICGCRTNNKQIKSEIIFKNDLLKSKIESYITSISHEYTKSNIISVICKNKHDTILFEIVNSCPDLSLVKFNGYMDFLGYKLCFVGTYPPNNFLIINKTGNIPDEVIKINNQSRSNSTAILNNTEPILWTLYFKGINLIKIE